MTWLLFLDESGHDHKSLPLEVRGGVALHVGKLWGFIQNWQRLERDCFGLRLAEFGKEAKGMKLLDKDRIRWAAQAPPMEAEERRKLVRAFLAKGTQNRRPTREEFTAYGQACQEMARGVFDLLRDVDATLFACAIRRGVRPPEGFHQSDYLRKDHAFLFERFYYFLESKHEHGLIVMDETDKALDRTFVTRMEAYFTRTSVGRNRSYWVIPAPLFVASDMACPVQAADVCLYALNWGFRPPAWGTEMETREDIALEFGPKLARLQWEGDGYRDGRTFRSRGIVFVGDPYGPTL